MYQNKNKISYKLENIKILVFEDECIVARDIQNMLKKLGYSESFVVLTGMDAIEKAKEIKPDLVLMEIK